MKIRYKKLNSDAKTPYKKNNGDFCYDLYASTDAMPVYDDDGNILGKYSTLKETEKRTGISASTVGNILKHVFSYSKVLKGKTFIDENQVQL
jgi:hypothetical protein